nr:MAG TPA: hypothetical protein [Caudoviricetes sp.]DAW04258.1 MAG TPA: hypothetical protein [Caudoviricetes sp.]
MIYIYGISCIIAKLIILYSVFIGNFTNFKFISPFVIFKQINVKIYNVLSKRFNIKFSISSYYSKTSCLFCYIT